MMGGRTVGKLFLLGARPRIQSFAHGGSSFILRRQPSIIEVLKGNERETTDEFLEVLRRAPDVFDFGAELVIIGDKCVGAIATGGVPDIWPHTSGRDDEEVRKRLFTAL